MKKILHIAKYYYPEIGGIEQVAKDMVEAFNELDVAQKVICFNSDVDNKEYKCEEKATVNLINKGDFLICYPEDAHRTAIICQQSQTIKKAIFKIKL